MPCKPVCALGGQGDRERRVCGRRKPRKRRGKKSTKSSSATHILLLLHTLLAVVGIRHARPAANGAAPCKGAKVALCAQAHRRVRAHVAVAHHALALAALAQLAHAGARLLAAHDEVWVVARCHSGPAHAPKSSQKDVKTDL